MQTMLSRKQREYAEYIFEHGYKHMPSFPYVAENRPCWHLVSMGLAVMDFGPRGSWLKCYGFMPVWSDPVC